ncbi:MAG: hypothetical protein EPO21_15040 [Chloroflexota bacterium]|nr:MAG: hypothetical protein EPO21_15040 [Chloroflexota bacterium]
MVFASLGLSGVGIATAAFLTPYKPVFLGATIALLGAAHFLLRKKSTGSPWNTRIVWGATALVAGQLVYSVVNTWLVSANGGQ